MRKAIGATGTTVTTAGLILGGTFAVLAFAGGGASGGSQIQQIGYGVAFGVVMDTFVVRTILVPAIVVCWDAGTGGRPDCGVRASPSTSPRHTTGTSTTAADDGAALGLIVGCALTGGGKHRDNDDDQHRHADADAARTPVETAAGV